MLVSSSVQARPQHLHLRHQLGQSEVDVLVVQQGLTEGLPLPQILDGLGDDEVHGGDCQCSTGQSLLLELEHLVGEAHPGIPDDVLGGHPHVVQVNHGGVRTSHSHLVDPLGQVDPGGVHRDTDQGLVQVRWTLLCVGKQADPVSLETPGRKSKLIQDTN